MVVTLVVAVVVTLVVRALVVAERIGFAIEGVEVNLVACGVDNLGLVQDCRERLAAGDLSHHRGDLATFVDGLGELVGLHAVLLGRHHEVLDQLGLGDADLLLLGDRIEQELRTHGPPGVGVDLGTVLFVLEPVLTLEVLFDLGLDQRVGHGDLGVAQQVLENLVPGLDALVVHLGAIGLPLDVGLELGEGVELRGELGEVVVELGQDALLDRLHRHGDLSVVALVLAAGQRSGEGLGLFDGHPDERVVEAVDHVAGADLVGDALGRVDLFLADRCGQVHGDKVASHGNSLDGGQGAEALTQGGHSRLDVGSGGLAVNRVDLDLDALVVGQLDLRAYVDLDGELQVLAILGRHLGHVDLRLAQRANLVLLDGLTVETRKRVVDGLLQHGTTADTLVDEPGGDLAGPEAGNLDL